MAFANNKAKEAGISILYIPVKSVFKYSLDTTLHR